ncbi:MAG: DNA-binding response OmpR family regulator [Candidatus Woesearchaeota archaeon]|jgi:DNA-binding response OmpR family regulator
MKKKILVVDDEPHIVNLLKLILQEEFVVYEAYSGGEALKLARRVEPDMIILDLMMPNIDGLQTCITLRSTPETRDTPIMVLSARSQVSDKFKSMNAGADDYMVKPFDPTELVRRIHTSLGISS